MLASPSKRRKNLALRAGTDGLLLPDDVTSAIQREQEQNGGTAKQSHGNGSTQGKPGEKAKEAVQPYTGADADAYDLIPTVPSWKAPDTPLEIDVGRSEAEQSEDDDAQLQWQRSTAAAEMRSPLGKRRSPSKNFVVLVGQFSCPIPRCLFLNACFFRTERVIAATDARLCWLNGR